MREQLKQKLLEKYPEWHNEPLRLTIEEIENPQTVLSNFFDCYTLPDLRACLKLWLEDALAAPIAETAGHVSTYNDIERLAEAAWLLRRRAHVHQQHEQLSSTPAATGVNNNEALPKLDEEWKKVQDFFGMLPLSEATNDLWEMTKRALTNPDDETSASERNMMLYLYENTIALYKAVHALLQLKNKTA